jgi:CRP-like cAMP-binding protein
MALEAVMKISDELLKKFGKKFPPEAIICKEGEKGSTMYLVHSGKIAILKSISTGEKVIAVLEDGQFFGEMALMGLQDTRSASAKALSETQVLELSPEAFEGLVRRSPEVAVAVIRTLCERLRDSNSKMAAFSYKSDAARIGSYLASYCENRGEKVSPSSPGKIVQISDETLANTLGVPFAKVHTFFELARKARIAARSGDWVWVPYAEYLVNFGEYISTHFGV